MRKFDNETVNAILQKRIKKYERGNADKYGTKIISKKSNIKPFLEYLSENCAFKDKYVSVIKKEYDNGNDLFYIRKLFKKFICNLYKANFTVSNPSMYTWDNKIKLNDSGIILQEQETKYSLMYERARKYIEDAFSDDEKARIKFLSSTSKHRIDLLSSLDLFCFIFREENNCNIISFYKKYTMFMNKVNSGRVCAWYSRSLEEIVEIWCIYNHKTVNHYEHILNYCEIDYRGIQARGILGFLGECKKRVNKETSINKLTATEDLKTSILDGMSEDSVDGFVEFIVRKIFDNPYNFSHLRHKESITLALEKLGAKKIEYNRFEDGKKNSYFSIREWRDFIEKTIDIINFGTKNNFYKYLYCCTSGIVEKTNNINNYGDLLDSYTYQLCDDAEKNFSYETELLILRSLIIVKHYNEDEQSVFISNSNDDLRELNLFEINSDTKLLRGFAIDYAVTNNL